MGQAGARELDGNVVHQPAVRVDQGLLGRLLGYGTIVVTGTGGTNEPFASIANPLEFRRQVQIRAAG